MQWKAGALPVVSVLLEDNTRHHSGIHCRPEHCRAASMHFKQLWLQRACVRTQVLVGTCDFESASVYACICVCVFQWVCFSFSFALKHDATSTSHSSRLPPQLTPLVEINSVFKDCHCVCVCVCTWDDIVCRYLWKLLSVWMIYSCFEGTWV